MIKKHRPDKTFILENLPPKQIDEIHRWFALENLDYKSAAARAQERLGIKTSATSMCRFFQKISVPRMKAKPGPPSSSPNVTIEIVSGDTRIVITTPGTVRVNGLEQGRADRR